MAKVKFLTAIALVEGLHKCVFAFERYGKFLFWYGFPTLYKEPKGLSTSAMAVTNFNISVTHASTVILLM